MRKTNPFIHCRCCLLVTSTELMIQLGLRQWKFIIGSAKNGSFHLKLRLLKAIWLKLMNTFFDRQTITEIQIRAWHLLYDAPGLKFKLESHTEHILWSRPSLSLRSESTYLQLISVKIDNLRGTSTFSKPSLVPICFLDLFKFIALNNLIFA